ncbi:MAG: hypothetical protein ACRC6O_13395 [Flavobacterium sp.]
MKLELNQTRYKTEADFVRAAIGNMVDLQTAEWKPAIRDDKLILEYGLDHYEVKGFEHLKPHIAVLIEMSNKPASAFFHKGLEITNFIVQLEKLVVESPKMERRKFFVERVRERVGSSFQKAQTALVLSSSAQ